MTLSSPHRHPELASGSICPPALRQRRQTKPDRQIDPVRIALFDQVDLPLPVPALQLLFAGDGVLHVVEHFEADQPVDMVSGCKPRQRPIAMLPKPRRKVGRHADIQRSVLPTGQDVDAGIACLPHGAECEAKWTLKQVQGDGSDLILEVFIALTKLRHAELVSASIEWQALKGAAG